jgi:UDP-N-acetylmuramoyl-tripeptide--D-alanyl-D-alanine ligase
LLNSRPAAFVLVEDTLTALQRLAAEHLRQLKDLTIVGITGSNGKTTTKEMLGAILSEHDVTSVSPGNLNSEIGLPLSAFRIRDSHRYAVFEMAINNPGEMDILADIARPSYAAITNIGVAHIGLLGSRERIAEEKRKIFTHIGADGWGFLADDEAFREYLAEACRGSIEYFGRQTTPGFEAARDLGLGGIGVVWNGHTIRMRTVGLYNVKNALCAISVALKLGVEESAIIDGLQKVKPLFGRGEVLHGAVTVVQDCYNANTDSVRELIDFVETLLWTGRKILVLGSMKELGSRTESEHRLIGRRAADSKVNAVFFYGEESAAAFREALIAQSVSEDGKLIQWTEDFEELQTMVKSFVRTGDLVLLKGSRGVELERLTMGITGMGL